MKRSLAVSGVNLTLFGSLKIAAATARQKSTSKPVQLPCVVGQAEAGERAVDAALDEAAVLHRLERLRGCAVRGEAERNERAHVTDTRFMTRPLSRRFC